MTHQNCLITTTHAATPKPRVVGYISSSYPDRVAIERWRARIRAYCEVHDLTLAFVYIDNGSDAMAAINPGLAALLLSVYKHKVHAVIVPSRSHFADDPGTQDAVERKIRGTGANIITICASQAC